MASTQFDAEHYAATRRHNDGSHTSIERQRAARMLQGFVLRCYEHRQECLCYMAGPPSMLSGGR